MSIFKRRFRRAVALGFAIGIGGVVLSLMPQVLEFDENVGLGALFAFRGTVVAPDPVVVVSISRDAAAGVGQSSELDTWPRELHAELIDKLAAAGAVAIAFDVMFLELREPGGDSRLAAAIAAAGNVLLAERIQEELIALGNGTQGVRERRLLPLADFKNVAFGTAPFVLPEFPVRVGQFWTFGRAAADIPSLPGVALQAYLLPHYADLVRLIAAARPGTQAGWPRSAAELVAAHALDATAQRLRGAFRADEGLAEAVRVLVRQESSLTVADKTALAVLLDFYAGPSSRYLNYYGPARSIRTIPYDRVLRESNFDVAGKMVFVGFAETRQSEQLDDFFTVFSQRTGANLSGVEVGATAFANLLEQRALVPLSMPVHLLLVLLLGATLGVLLGSLTTRVAAVVVVVVAGAYFGVAYGLFAAEYVWLPLVVPLLIQLPVAFIVTLWWNYRALIEQRERVHTALGYYVPRALARRLAEQSVTMGTDQLLHGTCLYTDAEHYTSVSESLSPAELAALMNDYYRALFRVVERFGGEISDTAGDSMVAIWASARPDGAARGRACHAAVAILDAVGEFNRANEGWQLPTYVGLESGELLLGNIGAEQRYEYRAVGDIVNTAARIQGLNRLLGTRVLVSAATLAGTSEQRMRDVGTFLLRGKRLPVRVYEPLAAARVRYDDAALACFAAALDAFRRGDWQPAGQQFAELVARCPDDGPSAYYLALAAQYEREAPSGWAGAVHVTVK